MSDSNALSGGVSRRQFLARTAVGAVVCAGLAGCKTLNTDARLLEVPLEGGRADLGSVDALQVGEQLKVAVQGADDVIDDVILVARVSDSEYRAVSISCPHFGSEVALVDGADGADGAEGTDGPDGADGGGGKFRCTNHGSEFDFDGKVLKGPAANPLKAYAVTPENGKLYLTIKG